MNLDNEESDDLIKRYNFLVSQYVDLAAELAEKLDKFGKFRQELQILSKELEKRNIDIKNKDLESKVETLISGSATQNA